MIIRPMSDQTRNEEKNYQVDSRLSEKLVNHYYWIEWPWNPTP